MSVDVESLLRLIAQIAQRGEPLAPGLRASALPGAERVAGEIERGADLRQALRTIVDPRHLDLLAGFQPTLERSALLAADLMREQRERRALMFDILAYPLLSLVAVAGTSVVVVRAAHLPVSAAWLWLLVPIALMAVCVLLMRWTPSAPAMPWIFAWSHHIAAASRYRRAALAARWRLPEADIAAWLGADLVALAPMLAATDASEHCQRLSDHHLRVAARSGRWLGFALTGVIYIAAAGIFLAGGASLVDRWVMVMAASGTQDMDQ
ncbi:MAG: hypothetical protein H0V44_14240 [Planctomycetes bacterium]|nr:hypothetical protein [Planctomycetota bacterium]